MADRDWRAVAHLLLQHVVVLVDVVCAAVIVPHKARALGWVCHSIIAMIWVPDLQSGSWSMSRHEGAIQPVCDV